MRIAQTLFEKGTKALPFQEKVNTLHSAFSASLANALPDKFLTKFGRFYLLLDLLQLCNNQEKYLHTCFCKANSKKRNLRRLKAENIAQIDIIMKRND